MLRLYKRLDINDLVLSCEALMMSGSIVKLLAAIIARSEIELRSKKATKIVFIKCQKINKYVGIL